MWSEMLEFVSLVRPSTLYGGVQINRGYLYRVPRPGLSTFPRRQDMPAGLVSSVVDGIVSGPT